MSKANPKPILPIIQTTPILNVQKFDWNKRREEQKKKWEEEVAKRKEYFEIIKTEYESICKQIGYCIFQYVGTKTFKPNLLMGDYDFLRMKNMEVVAKNYEVYIKFVREQEYYKKQNARKLNKSHRLYGIFYAPWSFKDRWKRIIVRLNHLGYVENFTEKLHNVNMTFYRFNKDKIKELEREAFIHFI